MISRRCPGQEMRRSRLSVAMTCRRSGSGWRRSRSIASSGLPRPRRFTRSAWAPRFDGDLDRRPRPRRYWERVRELVIADASMPLGGTDASVVALAERHGAIRVATLDRRHFTVVRPRHAQALELLPLTIAAL